MQGLIQRYPMIVGTDCLLYLVMAGRSSGITVPPDAARGQVVTVSGAVWNAKGWQFDGSNDRITGPSKITAASAFTILAWFKRLGNSGGAIDAAYHLIINGINGYAYNRLMVAQGGASVLGQVYISGVAKEATATISNATIFNYLAVVHDGSNITAYANAVAGTPVAAAGAPDSGVATPSIGWVDTDYYIANGIIGEIWVYSRALSAWEIQHNYYASKWRYI